MNLLSVLLVVLAGVYLSIRCMAAVCRVIDLGYALRRERVRVLRGLLGWLGFTALLLWLLPALWRELFLLSLLGYALLHMLLLAVLTRVLLPLSWRRARAARSAFEDGRHAHAARGTDGNQPAT